MTGPVAQLLLTGGGSISDLSVLRLGDVAHHDGRREHDVEQLL